MSYIDLDDVKAYLDDRIADETESAASLVAVIGPPTPGHLAARIALLEEVRKEIEWIEVNGYKPKHPEPGKLDALADDYTGGPTEHEDDLDDCLCDSLVDDADPDCPVHTAPSDGAA